MRFPNLFTMFQPHFFVEVLTLHMNFTEARDVAAKIAYNAGMHIRSRMGHGQDYETSEKGINDYVTTVDREAEEIIVDGLTEAFPSSTIMAEEASSNLPDRLPADDLLWIIDPIDGTTNFMHSLSPFAVSIGLASGGAVKTGVIYEVTHDEMYTAIEGAGAYLDGRRLRVSSTRTTEASLVATGFPYRRFDHINEYMETLRTFLTNVRGIRRNGAASIDLARVASGQFDGFYESGLHPWDVAAGALLVEEAGGVVTDYRGENNPVMRRQMLATNGHVHDDLLMLLESLKDCFS